jgi:hypothetical protein
MLLSFVLNIEHSHSALYLLCNLGYENLIDILVNFRSLICPTRKTWSQLPLISQVNPA